MDSLRREAMISVTKGLIAALEKKLYDLENPEPEVLPQQNSRQIKWHTKIPLGMVSNNNKDVYFRNINGEAKKAKVWNAGNGPYTSYKDESASRGFTYIGLDKLYKEIFK